MALDFAEQMQRLTTSAGQSPHDVARLQAGLLAMAGLPNQYLLDRVPCSLPLPLDLAEDVADLASRTRFSTTDMRSAAYTLWAHGVPDVVGLLTQIAESQYMDGWTARQGADALLYAGIANRPPTRAAVAPTLTVAAEQITTEKLLSWLADRWPAQPLPAEPRFAGVLAYLNPERTDGEQ